MERRSGMGIRYELDERIEGDRKITSTVYFGLLVHVLRILEGKYIAIGNHWYANSFLYLIRMIRIIYPYNNNNNKYYM